MQVVIAEDLFLLRDGLIRLLEAYGFEVSAAVDNGEDFLAAVRSHRPDIAETSRRENRVMLRLTPYATFETPPRHVVEPDDVKGLTHWLGSTLPWTE